MPIRAPDSSGRLADDTGLRPQICRTAPTRRDTWYFSRPAARSKKAPVWHGCQMPEQLSARIIRAFPIRRGRAGNSRQRHALAWPRNCPQVARELSPSASPGVDEKPLEGAAEPKLSAPERTAARKRRNEAKSNQRRPRRKKAEHDIYVS